MAPAGSSSMSTRCFNLFTRYLGANLADITGEGTGTGPVVHAPDHRCEGTERLSFTHICVSLISHTSSNHSSVASEQPLRW